VRLAHAAASLIAGALLVSSCGSDEGGGNSANDSVELSGGAPSRIARVIEGCLASRGYRTRLLPKQAGDPDAPDQGVAFQRGGEPNEGGEIAIYNTEAEAESRVPGIEANAEVFNGEVEAHGSVTVVYVAEPPGEVRDEVAACLQRAGPTDQAVIDELAGSYRGVRFGDTRNAVLESFGEPPPTEYEGNSPLRRRSDSGAPAWNCDIHPDLRLADFMRYEEVSFALDDGQVCDFVVIEGGAATQRGVAIGQELGKAKQVYPDLECGVANEGTDYRAYPYCAGKIAHQRFIWFGGDPIDTIPCGVLGPRPVEPLLDSEGYSRSSSLD
jgi:hypothetical protein